MIVLFLLIVFAVLPPCPAPVSADPNGPPDAERVTGVRDSIFSGGATVRADSLGADSLRASPNANPGAARDSVPAPTPVRTFPEVRVERERSLSEARRRVPTGFVSDLPIGVSGRALETIAGVLSEAAGVRVVEYGGLGSFSTVSLRGAPTGQVSVYLDGVPLASGAHGVVSLADLPATALERIEVYRGLSPLALGSASGAGAVNFVTGAPDGLHELRIVRGSFDTWETRATTGARRGPLALVVHGGYQGSKGDFDYPDDNGTPFNASDDGVSTRVNNRFDAATGLAILTAALRPGVALTLREDFFHKRQGLPGVGAVPAPNPRLSYQRSLTQAEIASRAGRVRPAIRLRGSLQRERSRFRDTDSQLQLGTHDTDDDFANDDLALDLESPRLPLGVTLLAASGLRDENADLHDALDGYPDAPASRRRRRSATIGLQLRPLGPWLTLHAAHRWDRIHDRLRSIGVAGVQQSSEVRREIRSPQLGAQLALPRAFEIRANWAKGERPPEFLELFGNQGNIRGNPLLQPERTETWDAGGSWAGLLPLGIGATIEAAHFESLARDLILYVGPPGSVKAQNVTRARIRGEELAARIGPAFGFTASGAYTWLDAIDEGPVRFWHGKRLPQRPGHQGDVRLGWTRGRLHAGGDLQYIGDNYLDRVNRYRVASRTISGVFLSLDVMGRLRLGIEGKNLADNRIADVGGFPLPGRSVFASCELRFAGVPSTSHEGASR